MCTALVREKVVYKGFAAITRLLLTHTGTFQISSFLILIIPNLKDSDSSTCRSNLTEGNWGHCRKFIVHAVKILLFVEYNPIDKRNISNIGIQLMLKLKQDTSSEDGLSVVRTMFDKGIECHKLSESRWLSRNQIVELTVKFLLDGENLEDRQHAVKLLKGTYICAGFRSFSGKMSPNMLTHFLSVSVSVSGESQLRGSENSLVYFQTQVRT